MNKIRKNLKAIVLSLGLAAMLLPASASAQGVFGDMLDNYYAEKEQTSNSSGMLLKGPEPDRSGESYGITNDGFGAPVGNGIAILIGAGLGYVALKKKED